MLNRNYHGKGNYFKVKTTKEGRALAMKSMIERAVRVKKELRMYIAEHGTSVGYDPDKTYAAL